MTRAYLTSLLLLLVAGNFVARAVYVKFTVKGFHCEHCAEALEEALSREETVGPRGAARVSFEEATAEVIASSPNAVSEEDEIDSILSSIASVVADEGLEHQIITVSSKEAFEERSAESTRLFRSVASGILEASPWLLFGATTTGIARSAISDVSILKKYLGRSIFGASVVGLAVPFCSCGAVPLAIALLDAGIGSDVVLSFLISSQSAGIDSLPVTVGLLGPTAAATRLLGAIMLSVSAGFALGRSRAKGPIPTRNRFADRRKVKNSGSFVTRVLQITASTIREVAPWLLAGVLATEIVAPRARTFGATFSSPSGIAAALGQLALFGLALPLQACEHATASFVRALKTGGASPGTASAFLLVAPATNLATMGLVLRSRGPGATARVAAAVVGSAYVFSTIVDRVEWLRVALSLPESASASVGQCLPYPLQLIGVCGCACLLLWDRQGGRVQSKRAINKVE